MSSNNSSDSESGDSVMEVADSAFSRSTSQHMRLGATIHPLPVHKENHDRQSKQTICRVKFKHLAYLVIAVLTGITIVDRFTLNLWHMGVNGKGPFMDGFAVSFFITLSWISGRIMLVSTNVSFVTQCRVFWNMVAENAPNWLDCEDIHQVNNEIHAFTGIYLTGLSVVLHTWSIFVPYAFGVPMRVFGTWSRPIDPNKGKPFSFYTPGVGVSVAGNDIWRLCTTTICFFFLLPYSMSKWGLKKHWTIAMYIHVFAAMVYTIDLVRIKSHPHCWVFNCPFVFLYFVDRFIGIWSYRRYPASKIVQRIFLGDNYMVLFLRTDHLVMPCIGDVYYLNLLTAPWSERAHPFTCFYNHSGIMTTVDEQKQLNPSYRRHKFVLVNKDHPDGTDAEIAELYRRDTGGESEMSISNISAMHAQMRAPTVDWDVAALVQIHDGETTCGAKRNSWTTQVASVESRMLGSILVWGPYRSEYRELERDVDLGRPIVLIATGAGASFIIDFVQWMLSRGSNAATECSPIQIYFSCASLELFQYVADVLCADECVLDGTTIMLHLTSKDNVTYLSNGEYARDAAIGRASFESVCENAAKDHPDAVVYFCGSPTIQEKVKKVCARVHLKVRVGHAFHQ